MCFRSQHITTSCQGSPLSAKWSSVDTGNPHEASRQTRGGTAGCLSRMVRDGREGSMGEKIHREVQETARVRDDDISGQDGGRRAREEERFEMVRPGD